MNGAPLLYIFAPKDVPQEYLDNFRKWTKEAGFPDLYLVANISTHSISKESMLAKGFNAVSYQRLGGITSNALRNMGRAGRGINKVWKNLKGYITHRPPFMTDYKNIFHSW